MLALTFTAPNENSDSNAIIPLSDTYSKSLTVFTTVATFKDKVDALQQCMMRFMCIASTYCFLGFAKVFPDTIDLNNFGKCKLLLCLQIWVWEDVNFEMVIMWGISFFPLFAARNPPFWGLETEFCLWWLSSQQDRNLSPLGILKPNTIQTNGVLTPCAGAAASALT